MLNQIIFGEVTLMRLLMFILIILSAFLFTRLANRWMNRNLKEKIQADHLQLVNKLNTYGVMTAAILFSVPLIGQSLSGLVVAGGVAGVVLGFASQNVVSNFIAGIFIMIERPLKIGHSVTIGGATGIVEEIRVMSTIIRTFEGLYVRIPNISVFTNTLVNNVYNAARRIEYTIGIRYSDDADLAVRTILDKLDQESLVLVNPAPEAFVALLGDNSVNLSVRYWAPAPAFWELKTKMLNILKVAIENVGVEIPFPQRVIWQGKEPEPVGTSEQSHET